MDSGLCESAELLWQSVVELVVTVFEDHPVDTDLAFVDDLMEQVSELQGAVREARLAADAVQPSGKTTINVERLAVVDEACDRAALRYWRDLVGFRTVYELRRAAAQRSGEWRGWATGVELALDRCAQPLQDLRTAIRTTWVAGSRQVVGTNENTSDSRRSA